MHRNALQRLVYANLRCAAIRFYIVHSPAAVDLPRLIQQRSSRCSVAAQWIQTYCVPDMCIEYIV